MELTILVDNNTLIDRYLLGEPGLSLHLRTDAGQVLFDCGYSGVACTNAARLGIALPEIDTVVLSHGHLDHSWGLAHLVSFLTEQAFEDRPVPRPRLLAHPEALSPRNAPDGRPIGGLLSRAILAEYFELELSREPVAISDRLVFLGEIPRRTDFEKPAPSGTRLTADGPVPDTVPDDTALAWLGRDGLVIVTGCSHAGIGNIVEQARAVTGERRLAAVIGGLHLLGPEPQGLAATVEFLRRLRPAALYPCHCTSLAAKSALARAAPVIEVGAGSRFVWD
jgi:7,8-dihydropterin-6-yl-methyl-4-(beta-D-ribofuranosyl)aminobenzene 5'-phosphate synthase